MSDSTPPIPADTPAGPAADENVQRGTLFALAAIPISIAAFAFIGGLTGFITGILAILIPYITAFFYSKGAGAPLTRKGWGPFIGVAGAAVVLGTFSGVVGGVYSAYQAVGGSGGIFASAFWRTVGNQFTINLADNFFAILIGIGLGAAGIVSVIRNGGKMPSRGAGNPAQSTMPGQAANPVAPTGAAPAQPSTPAAPPAPPVAPNQPSPGVMLNGKPIEPTDGKKK